MNDKRPSIFLYGMLLAALAFAFDQATKACVLRWYETTSPPIPVTSFFNMVMVWNKGVSFGMLSGRDLPWLLTALTAVIACALIVWMWKHREPWIVFPAGLIAGGAFGNILDRLRYGAVADFFDFHLAGFHWPAFNVADSCIVIGVALLAWQSLRKPRTSA